MSLKNFRPKKNKISKTGQFIPTNPLKYIGNPNQIWFRSGLELKFMKELDVDPRVVKWEYEPTQLKIKYLSPIDGKFHTYYPDMYCEKILNGKLIKFLIEVKPKSQVMPPKKPTLSKSDAINKKRRLKFNIEVNRHTIIHAKRKYAEDFANRHGMKYLFITDAYVGK